MRELDNYYGTLKAYEQYYTEIRERIEKDLVYWEKKDLNRNPIEKHLIPCIGNLPDLYLIALRLLTCKNLPDTGKGTLFVGLMYCISPVDFISDHITVFGWVDDLVVLAIAIEKYIRQNHPLIQLTIKKHWRNSIDLLETVQMIISIFVEMADHFPPSMVNIIFDMFGLKTSQRM